MIKLINICRIFCLIIFFGSLLLLTLTFHIKIDKAQNGSRITQSEAQANSSKILSGERRKKELDMTDKDKLTDEDGKYLLEVARRTIAQRLSERKKRKESYDDLPDIFHERRGTFVTLTIQGGLRGCIGHITPQESLLEGIKVNAMNAAFKDPRFRPLSTDEWKNVKIEISILTEPQALSYADANDLLKKLRPDIDGVIIKKGYHQSTFLPQVWEQLPGKEEFLAHLCLKAGLDGGAWKKGDLEVYTYQVQAFEE